MVAPSSIRCAKDVRTVARRLSARYGDFTHFNRKNPLEELLFILCSIQTNEALYRSTYRSLRLAFPRLELLSAASVRDIAKAIELGGLANQKARMIKVLLTQVIDQFGRPSLATLKKMGDDECEQFLTSLHGVGKKTARCVMMYSLGRAVFPVDTHCWRICRRLAWVRPTRPDRSCSPKDMDRLQSKIPGDARFSLHVNMVSLGRDVCTSGVPSCDPCVIRSYCRRIGVKLRRP